MRYLAIILCMLILAGCSSHASSVGIIGGADGPTKIMISTKESEGETQMEFQCITQPEAKEIMDSGAEYILVDAREQDEYDEGHIPGAILMPHQQTRELAQHLLPKKDALILVYCRSGRRSKLAAAELAAMGYSDVREFGGIIDWPYEIEK